MGFAEGFQRAVKKNPELVYGAIGATFGGGTDYAINKIPYIDQHHRDLIEVHGRRKGLRGKKLKNFVDKKRKLQRRVSTALGAISGGVVGAMAGAEGRMYDDFEQRFRGGQYHRRAQTGQKPLSYLKKVLDLSGSETTKAEVQKKWRELAKKHHPDIGGNPETMKEINAAWTAIQQSEWFEKLARVYDHTPFWQGFR